jgi:hypothetical protein
LEYLNHNQLSLTRLHTRVCASIFTGESYATNLTPMLHRVG